MQGTADPDLLKTSQTAFSLEWCCSSQARHSALEAAKNPSVVLSRDRQVPAPER
jgi:hypothetical protein